MMHAEVARRSLGEGGLRRPNALRLASQYSSSNSTDCAPAAQTGASQLDYGGLQIIDGHAGRILQTTLFEELALRELEKGGGVENLLLDTRSEGTAPGF